jgi:hypothetical protein
MTSNPHRGPFGDWESSIAQGRQMSVHRRRILYRLSPASGADASVRAHLSHAEFAPAAGYLRSLCRNYTVVIRSQGGR